MDIWVSWNRDVDVSESSSKQDIFRNPGQFLRSNINFQISLKTTFTKGYQIGRTSFIKNLFHYNNSWKNTEGIKFPENIDFDAKMSHVLYALIIKSTNWLSLIVHP